MNNKLELQELVQAGVISEETAERIRAYYSQKKQPEGNRIFAVFGVIGAILVGLGIILILEHNWDNLPRIVKTVLAFLPLLIGQGFCGFTLFKKRDSQSWREGSAAFLFFAVGACVALVSQIYSISGNLSDYLLTWMLLCLPLVYLMSSSAVSVLYLLGITWYAVETCYWGYPSRESYLYWGLLLAIVPHYISLLKGGHHNFALFHHWLIPISLTIVLGTIGYHAYELLVVAYFILFGLFYLFGQSGLVENQAFKINPYIAIGSLGTTLMMLGLSFDLFWQEWRTREIDWGTFFVSPEMLGSGLMLLAAIGLLYNELRTKSLMETGIFSLIFLIFIPIFVLGASVSSAVVFINLLLLAAGLLTVFSGAQQDHLGVLNFGLLIIAALVICRFFDTDLSYVVRGLLFISVGAGFFAANYWMLQKRKTHES